MDDLINITDTNRIQAGSGLCGSRWPPRTRTSGDRAGRVGSFGDQLFCAGTTFCGYIEPAEVIEACNVQLVNIP